MRRYSKLRAHFHLLNSTEVDEVSLSTAENRHLTKICERLGNLHSITRCRQKDSTTTKAARALFDLVMTDYPGTKKRLSVSAVIVHSPHLSRPFSKYSCQRHQCWRMKSVMHCSVLSMKEVQALQRVRTLCPTTSKQFWYRTILGLLRYPIQIYNFSSRLRSLWNAFFKRIGMPCMIVGRLCSLQI